MLSRAYTNVFTQPPARLPLARGRTTWSGSHALSRNPSGRRKTKQTREEPWQRADSIEKRGPYYLQRGPTRSDTYAWASWKWVGALLTQCFSLCLLVLSAAGGLASKLKLTRLLGCCCGMRKGADGGHTDWTELSWAELKKEAILVSSALLKANNNNKNHSVVLFCSCRKCLRAEMQRLRLHGELSNVTHSCPRTLISLLIS